MQIGRTNASTGGGTTKSCYQLWQEGFNTNWDNVVTNASMTYNYRILHVYVASERLYLISFSAQSNKQIAIYNANTKTYRYTNVQVDTNSGYNYITFQPSDYFTNSQDGLSYVCVVYASGSWGDWAFRFQLPVVYANNKGLVGCEPQQYVSIIGDGVSAAITNYPLLRGIDLDILSSDDIYIYNSIEHISYQRTSAYNGSLLTYTIRLIQGNDAQLNIFNTIYDDLVLRGNRINPIDFKIINLNLCNTNLADDFYNKFLYNVSGNNYYNFPVGTQVNFVENFKIKQTPLKSPSIYLTYAQIPSCVHIEGKFEEVQENHDAQGKHGFTSTSYTNLVDFPMWKVLDGATTGCLRPAQNTAINGNYNNFYFVSNLLDPRQFAEFDTNGNIKEDPNKYFICNLPVAKDYAPLASTYFARITLPATFKNWYTTAQRTTIGNYLTAKKWVLMW